MSATKIGESKTKNLKTAIFHNKFTLCKINQISTYRKLNLPLTSSIYYVSLPVEMQKRLKETKVYPSFSYLVWKETTQKPLKEAATRNPFLQRVSYWWNLLRWIYFYSMWKLEEITFRENLLLLWDFWSATLLLSLKPVFGKKSVFYALSPQ